MSERDSGAPKADGPADPLRLERRDGGRTAIIWFDVPGERVNTLRAGFDQAFERVLDELERDQALEAVVLASAKPDSFVAGADIGMLQGIETAEQAQAMARRAQQVMDRIAGFRLPIVAAIHGACLGGGLELALACRGRVASDARATRLGLPEVQLGLIPGAGGTQRLPRLVGLEAGLDLILTGRRLPADRAYRLGLIDEVVHPAILLEVALEHARRLAAGERPAERRQRGLVSRLRTALSPRAVRELVLEDNPLGRKLVFQQARKQTLARTRGHYPAPLEAIEVIRTGIEQGMARGLQAEAEAFGRLAVSEVARRLMELFFAQNELKKDRGVDDPTVEPRPVRKVAVLGAGLMGSGIAYVTAAEAGLPVRLKDRDDAAVRAGMRAVRRILDERVARRRLSPRERDRLLMLVRPTTEYTGFRGAEVAIEAVFEDLELKRRVLRETEQAGGPEIIFASNTSTIPIRRIAEASAHPETVIGMHYFSPVEKMPLLEVIVTERTAPWVIATCVALGKRQGKTVIVVHDGPGFYTSRVLGPYVAEAAHLLAEGVPIEAIDRALVEFGFPVGPIKLLDEVGIDVAAKAAKVMHQELGERMRPPDAMARLVEAGRLGRKSNKGFYLYAEEHKRGSRKHGKGERPVDPTVYELLGVSPDKELAAEQIALRCTLQMVNEAAHCYGEGILRSARDGDVGAVFGLGFPPFLGGPFRWADTRGARWVLEQLERFAEQLGPRFAPAPVLRELAERTSGFYAPAAPPPGRWRRETRGGAPAPEPAAGASRSG